MPVKNYNGTAFSDIGKMYLFNGTGYNQISKAHSFDGTANSLIYNDEIVIVSSSSFQNGYNYTALQSNWLSMVSGTTVTQRRPDQASSGNYVTSTWILLPTSQFDTLTMQYSSWANTSHGGLYAGAAAALRTEPGNSEAMSKLTNGALKWCGHTWGGSTGDATVTWDISSITTDCYLQIGCYQYGWANMYDTGASFTIKSLILT